MLDAHQHVLQLAIGRQRVVGVVGDHHRQAQIARQARRSRRPASRRRAGGGAAARRRNRPARTSRPGARAAAAAPSRSPASRRRATSPWRQPDSATSPSVFARQQLVREARRALGAGQVRVAGQAAQAAVAGHVARDQHEVRPQLAGAHAAQVLAPRLAMSRRTQAFDSRLGCLAVSRSAPTASSDCPATARAERRFRLRRGTIRPAGSATTASSSSTSMPTIGRRPASWAAVANLTAP